MKFSSFGEGSRSEGKPGRDLNNSVATPPTTCPLPQRPRESSAVAFSHSLPLLSCPRGDVGSPRPWNSDKKYPSFSVLSRGYFSRAPPAEFDSARERCRWESGNIKFDFHGGGELSSTPVTLFHSPSAFTYDPLGYSTLGLSLSWAFRLFIRLSSLHRRCH